MSVLDHEQQLQPAQRLRQRMTTDTLARWMGEAKPGASVIYGVGVVATLAARAEINAYVLQAEKRGLVTLTQKKRPDSPPEARYEYRMTRTSRPLITAVAA